MGNESSPRRVRWRCVPRVLNGHLSGPLEGGLLVLNLGPRRSSHAHELDIGRLRANEGCACEVLPRFGRLLERMEHKVGLRDREPVWTISNRIKQGASNSFSERFHTHTIVDYAYESKRKAL